MRWKNGWRSLYRIRWIWLSEKIFDVLQMVFASKIDARCQMGIVVWWKRNRVAVGGCEIDSVLQLLRYISTYQESSGRRVLCVIFWNHDWILFFHSFAKTMRLLIENKQTFLSPTMYGIVFMRMQISTERKEKNRWRNIKFDGVCSVGEIVIRFSRSDHWICNAYRRGFIRLALSFW